MDVSILMRQGYVGGNHPGEVVLLACLGRDLKHLGRRRVAYVGVFPAGLLEDRCDGVHQIWRERFAANVRTRMRMCRAGRGSWAS